MGALKHIFWLGTKELRAVLGDAMMVGLILFTFTGMVYMQATALPENVNHASIAIVDEDNSSLSRQIANAFYPPYFQTPVQITAGEVDAALDGGDILFALSIPNGFEADLRRGHQPEIQLDIDATAVMQAGLGDAYIQNIVNDEVARYLSRADAESDLAIGNEIHRAFNPNGTMSWFNALTGILDFLNIIIIMLTGAALVREREHGTIEHLMVMPLHAVEIALAKIWANGLIVLVAFGLSMSVVVEGWLNVPVAGSRWILMLGATLYLFAASAIGILLGTVARSMAQFALLVLLVVIPMMLLSGGISPVESQPEMLQPFTALLPSRHYMAFSQAVVFRGAGLDVVWPDLLRIAGMGLGFLLCSLLVFRRSLSAAS
ncbi:ABC transporter permease [Rhodovulum marinum]|uniref:ABC-2 type transport system permease protein n=1 Tax=Rhodovulum marinum TaxID=320662 RepID=A0A4R2PVV1_9RHOB|nr:ABC transporter permease [Rhodovulum marinum]TCP39248.1 ABC-2 type transport system permease protein [Rhodovulum marinum]